MKKFLAALTACTAIFTSAFVCNKANAEIYDYENAIHGKAVFLGDVGVGKVKIIKRFCEDHPNDFCISGENISIKRVADDHLCKVQIVDTSGEEKFQSFISPYLHNADVVVICCNYGIKSSFDSIEKWVEMARNKADSCNIIIVSHSTMIDENKNKHELDKSKWQFSENDVMELGNRLGAAAFSASSLTGLNVDELFNEIAHFCVKNNRTHRVQYDQEPEDNTDNDRKKCLIC